MGYIMEIGKNAKESSKELALMSSDKRNKILEISADALMDSMDYILSENKKDLEAGAESGLSKAFMDRLELNQKRVASMANGLRDVASLKDEIGKIYDMETMASGLVIGKKRVPLGVVCIIYESRPNVTADAFGLCIKSGNSIILKGGKEAINSNIAIVNSIKRALFKNNINHHIIQLVESTEREATLSLMRMNK